MFTVNSRFTNRSYEYVELLVHGDLKLYRREIGGGNDWFVQDHSGAWTEEDILNEIVSECHASVKDGFTFLDA